MKRRIFSVLFALVLVLSFSLTAVPAAVSAEVSTVVLSTSGDGIAEWTTDQAHEGSYSIHLAAPGKCDWNDYAATYADALIQIPLEGVTLNDITSMSWWNYLVNGYPPALRIKLDVDANGESDYHLVAEFAYQEWDTTGFAYTGTFWVPYTHYKPGLEATNDFYYPTYDTWMQTFHTTDIASGDPDGPRPADTETTTVHNDTIFWVMVVGGAYNVDWHSAPYASLPSYFATLNDYKTSAVTNLNGSGTLPVLGDAEVLMLEFAITNEIGLTGTPAGHEVYFDHLTINGIVIGFEPTGSVGLTADNPQITAISVTPTSIDFGTLYPGQSSSVTTLTISNIGSVDVSVATSIDETGTFFTDNLWLDVMKAIDYFIDPLTVGGTPATPGAKVVVPSTYPAVGEITGTLIFEATAK